MAVKGKMRGKKPAPAAMAKKADELKKIAAEKKKLLLKKKIQEEEEEDDDDDDDDESEDNNEQMDSEGDEEADSDDDDEDDDEEDDDDDDEDDDDDDDEDEEEEVVLKTPQNGKKAKQLNASKTEKAKTPKNEQKKKAEETVKESAKKSKNASVLEAATPKTKAEKRKAAEEAAKVNEAKKAKVVMLDPADVQKQLNDRKRERDLRSLFVRGFTFDTPAEKLKSLSDDIIDVRVPTMKASSKKNPKAVGFAFLEFESEAVTEANYKKLQKKKLGNKSLLIDYVGDKSKTKPKSKRTEGEINKKKLYVGGLSATVTREELTALFPGAHNIQIEKRSLSAFAKVAYPSAELANKAFSEGQRLKLKGKPLTVLFARLRTRETKNKERRAKKRAEQKKKKAEEKAKEGSDDDEDDDDNEEGDDDDEEGNDSEGGEEESDDDDDEDDDDEDDE